LLMFFSGIHVVATGFSFFFTEIYYDIVLPLFSEYVAMITRILIMQNSYPGIAGQTGTNAFFISLGLSAIISGLCVDYFNKNATKKVWRLLLLILFIIAIFATQKRGLIIANVIAMSVVFYVSVFKYRKSTLFFIVFLICTIVAALFLL